MTNDLKKLQDLMPNSKISQKVFELYERKSGKNITKITQRALHLFETKGCKIERAMADALLEHMYRRRQK